MFKQFVKETPFGISLLVLVVALGLLAIIAPIFGNKALIVRSGSMEPSIKTGDVVVVNPTKDYKTGDIIAFKDPIKPSIIVTHRIIGEEIKNGHILYKTRGDANNATDSSLVPKSSVIGKADYGIKSVGKIFAYAKTKTGFLTLIAIPASFVIILELVNIFREIKKPRVQTVLKHIYHHYGKPMGVSHSSSSFKNVFNFSLRASPKTILSVLASFLIISSTFAFFSDTATSTNNVFSAAESFCNSTQGHIVINEVFYDVDTVHNGQGSENDWEWVELYNPTSSPVSLTGWSIADGNSSDALPGTSSILPCGFAIVSPSSEAELEDQTNDGGNWTIPDGTVFITLSSAIGNGFANGGDSVILKDGSAAEIDSMSYGTDTGELNPSVPAVASGHSLERNPDGLDTDTNTDFVDRNPPTPGT